MGAGSLLDVLTSLWRMKDAAEAAGGISMRRALEEDITIPEGWRLDPVTHYFLPPDVILFPVPWTRD